MRNRFVVGLILVVLWLGLGTMGYLIVHHAPGSLTTLAALEVQAPHSAVIGYPDLLQPPGIRAAAKQHLAIDYHNGQWQLRNVARHKKVDAPTNQLKTRYLKRWRLRTGDQIWLDDVLLDIAQVTSDAFAITQASRTLRWSAGHWQVAGESFNPGCADTVGSWWWRDFYQQRGKEWPVLRLGGQVNCAHASAKITNIPPDAARIVWYQNAFWLVPGQAETRVRMARAGQSALRFSDLALPWRSAEGTIQRVVLGRTHYRVEADPKFFRLVPIAGVSLWPKGPLPEVTLGEGVQRQIKTLTWVGDQSTVSTKDWLLKQQNWWLCWVGMVFLLLLFYQRRRYQRIGSLKLDGLIAASGLLLAIVILRLWRDPTDSDVLLFTTWIVWGWATLVLFCKQRLAGKTFLLWGCLLLLAAIGLLNLLQFSVGGEHSRWLTDFDRHALLLAAAGLFLGLLALFPVAALEASCCRLLVAQSIERWLLRLVFAVLLVALLVQMLIGAEEGLAGLQPVEASKFFLVLIAALTAMDIWELRRVGARAFRQQPAKFIGRFTKYFVLLTVLAVAMMGGVRDFSPIIILGLFLLVWLWRVAAPFPGASWSKLRGLVLVICGTILLAATWLKSDPQHVPNWLPSHERFQVWANPSMYPQAGHQVIEAMRFTAEGSWVGAADYFGTNGAVMQLPAVQDDFIMTFLTHHYGGLAGIFVLLLQLFYLGLLFHLADETAQWSHRSGHVGQRQTGYMLSGLLFGLAWVQATHWVIAWGNTLGLLPVMGQPMSWFAAGNSHLLFFAWPVVVVGLLCSWFVEARGD